MEISLIIQIITALVSIATLLILVIKVTRHITSLEGKISTKEAELVGKINVLQERSNNSKEEMDRLRDQLLEQSRYLRDFGYKMAFGNKEG